MSMSLVAFILVVDKKTFHQQANNCYVNEDCLTMETIIGWEFCLLWYWLFGGCCCCCCCFFPDGHRVNYIDLHASKY